VVDVEYVVVVLAILVDLLEILVVVDVDDGVLLHATLVVVDVLAILAVIDVLEFVLDRLVELVKSGV
jgi:hypothetical protein